MSYYRAALAAAERSNLTLAYRLVRCSIALGEDAPSAARLLELLHEKSCVGADKLGRLRELTEQREFAKALKVRLPKTTKAYTIRGLLFARIGRRRAARKAFASALALDTGNALARQALRSCLKIRR